MNFAKKSDTYTLLAFYHLSDNASTSVGCCTASGAGFETLVFDSYHRRTQIFLGGGEGGDPETKDKLNLILKSML